MHRKYSIDSGVKIYHTATVTNSSKYFYSKIKG